MKKIVYPLIPFLLLLVSCRTTEPTIGKLGEREIKLEEPEITRIDRAVVIKRYRKFVKAAKGGPLYGEAMRRLADLELEQGEALSLSSREREARAGSRQIQRAIKMYQDYLLAYPRRPDNDLIYYQLAKAYSLTGDTANALKALTRLVNDYPATRYYDEVQFRRGEILFVARKFVEAGKAYNAVINYSTESRYYEKALYKYGWSLFKQNKYIPALNAYMEFLDRKYQQGQITELGHAADLPRADQEILDDTLRVVSLAFTYQQGDKSLQRYFERVGDRPYGPLIYHRLGDLYLRKERLLDAADTYMAYVKRYPESAFAPQFQSDAIEIYKQGGFSQLVLSAKEDFVKRFGVGSNFWQYQSKERKAELKPLIIRHIRELASHYHAVAQKSGAAKDYQRAASWYGVFLKSFPREKDAARINFLFAETLFDAGRYAVAIDEFETTAYRYPRHEKSAEAGYAALLAYKALEKQLNAYKDSGRQLTIYDKPVWHERAIKSAIKFSNTFPQDKRVPQVLVNVSKELFDLKAYRRAIYTAELFLKKKQARQKQFRKLRVTALTIAGHSRFELKNYALAENAYGEVLQLISPEDKLYKPVSDRLAASIYKQGEKARELGNVKLAAYHFLRVGKSVTASSLVAIADYDGASMLIQAGEYKQAATVLEKFRKRYPKNHKLQAGVTEKLALVYSKTGQGAKAATELLALANASADAEYRRQLMWQAAELYDKSNEKRLAVKTYKQYLKKYAKPFPLAMEARHRIAEYYRKKNDSRKWRYWLKKIIVADANAGSERNVRSTYLAASATLHLANPYRSAFKKTRLTIPLKKSLRKKKRLMKKTIKAYERALKYQVAEVTTEATYQIAEVYHDFARALMKSQRPKGLNAEELEQYDLLLEEQAFPFEEKAIDIHTVNLGRIKEGLYDKWTRGSLKILQQLQPVRYAKVEKIQAYVETIN